VSDERDGVTPGSDDPGAPDATTPTDAEDIGPVEGVDAPGGELPAGADAHDPEQDDAAEQDSAPEVAARPTGKRRTAGAGSRPARPVAEGSKRASGRSTARRSVAEAPSRRSPVSRVARFLREVVSELRKVIWPTRKELVTYTSVVLVFVTFMVALVSGLDILFAKGVLALFG
jgi:preprotein translocase subunit SecE